MLYSPIWFVAALGFLLLVVRTPLFKAADLPPTAAARRRIATLDGSRGFLALDVFFHHALIYHDYIVTEACRPPPSHFYAILGPLGVAVFFMITGFLFWGKLVDERGAPDWPRLYIGRIFRIGPLYVVAIIAMIVSVFAHSDWQLRGTLFGLIKTCAPWFALGILGQGNPINHYPETGIILAGVTWTLWYEWVFYVALVPLAPFARSRPKALAVSTGLFAILLACDAIVAPTGIVAPPLTCACLFAGGMVTASLARTNWLEPVSLPACSAASLVVLGSVCVIAPDLNHAAPLLALTLVFVLVASGSDVFGLLTSRGALRLGDMSYGLYLLQGVVLDAVFANSTVRHFALATTGGFWLCIMLAAIVLVCCATVTLVFVERPGVALGRRLGRTFETRWSGRRLHA